MEEAKPLDSIKIVPSNNCADMDNFQIKGLTLPQVEKIYGKHHFVAINGARLNDPKEMPNEDFSGDFSKSDCPIVIYAFDWFRNPNTKKMFDKANGIWDLYHYDGNLGMCMRVYFVEYNNQLIAFDAFQIDFRRLQFVE